MRQLLGSANIDGGPLFHLMTGNLSHQIEHHLFPDLPSNRYAEIAPQVRALCERFGLPYTTGPLLRQTASVWKRVLRLALPGPRRKSAPVEPSRPERRVRRDLTHEPACKWSRKAVSRHSGPGRSRRAETEPHGAITRAQRKPGQRLRGCRGGTRVPLVEALEAP